MEIAFKLSIINSHNNGLVSAPTEVQANFHVDFSFWLLEKLHVLISSRIW
jgi:hypothetical protein